MSQNDNTQYYPLVQEDKFNLNLWDYLTTFWDYLSDDDRELFENYWQGLRLATNNLITKSTRLYNSSAPEQSEIYPIEDYYEIILGPLTSKPLNLDPTNKNDNYTIRAIREVSIEPQYDSNLKPIYQDLIEISSSDYYKIREIGLNNYIVVKANRSDIKDQYFKILNLLSSKEPNDRKHYAEIDKSFSNGEISDDLIGVMSIEGLYTPDQPDYKDISHYNVQVISADESEIIWGDDYLLIKVASGDNINDVISASSTGTPWATFINKSGLNYSSALLPIFGGTDLDEYAVEFLKLSLYKCAEQPNGRYYPYEGNIWKWYSGYNSSNGTIGTTNQGEWVSDESKSKFMIKVDGDLSYLENETFNIYLTTAKAYDIDKNVIDIQYLHSHISGGYPVEFRKDIDFTFNNYILEFNRNIFEDGAIPIDSIVYCQKVSIIENYLYELYGNLINISDWNIYNHNNYSGKMAISSIMKGIQNINNGLEYKQAMNSYYGQPLSPDDGKVIGLYESYPYKIISIDKNNNLITVELKSPNALHPFVQVGGKFLTKYGDISIISIIDRLNGIIKLSDVSDLLKEDLLYLKLTNNFILKDVAAEEQYTPASIVIYSAEGPMPIQHMINFVYDTSKGIKYPEILIYNNTNKTSDYSGIYHITQAIWHNKEQGLVRLQLYKKSILKEPLYNDYMGVSANDVVGSFVHIPWPTHKFLYLQLNNGDYFKAYLDAPIDTILNPEDSVTKYQILARNASIFNESTFPSWSQFDQFKKYNGIHEKSNILETIRYLKYAEFGSYFPSNYSMNITIAPKQIILFYQNIYGFGHEDFKRFQKSYLTFFERGSGLPNMQNNYLATAYHIG